MLRLVFKNYDVEKNKLSFSIQFEKISGAEDKANEEIINLQATLEDLSNIENTLKNFNLTNNSIETKDLGGEIQCSIIKNNSNYKEFFHSIKQLLNKIPKKEIDNFDKIISCIDHLKNLTQIYNKILINQTKTKAIASINNLSKRAALQHQLGQYTSALQCCSDAWELMDDHKSQAISITDLATTSGYIFKSLNFCKIAYRYFELAVCAAQEKDVQALIDKMGECLVISGKESYDCLQPTKEQLSTLPKLDDTPRLMDAINKAMPETKISTNNISGLCVPMYNALSAGKDMEYEQQQFFEKYPQIPKKILETLNNFKLSNDDIKKLQKLKLLASDFLAFGAAGAEIDPTLFQHNAEYLCIIGAMYCSIDETFTEAFGATTVVRDTQKGERLLLEAAVKGSTDALYYLGMLYITGKGLPKNVTRGKSFLESAAKQGHEFAREALTTLEAKIKAGHADVCIDDSAHRRRNKR